ncbi:M1 family aminopeptidase [Parasediminibacterium paludis]|uniref:Aminopeptidase N n=1 Tax=Parasediminibacterium paludis TaxID=908966 RepID=A0ABV8PUY0_9BACT
MKQLLLALSLFVSLVSLAQPAAQDTTWKKQYRAFAPKVNDLVHTKLEAKFDYAKQYMYGKVWLTLKPHFYATDSLQLDAKGLTINKLEIVKAGRNTALQFTNTKEYLIIKLDKPYKGGETYTIYIDYISKPNELEVKGSAAISDAKGLYFINPLGEEKNKPTQIWTQGETESNSAWVPTIDKPNQKTTTEFCLTVPAKYVTLSNGRLVSQIKNTDGTRTDCWKMELPHAPYLMFMGIGDFAIVKDSYKGKEVSYYVEKEYEKVARKIFGLTPEMIKFFSEKVTGVDFPWNKYAQIVGRDYVSGAMENTTSTLHGEGVQQNARELVDGNGWEGTIAHELFHQWFGDYVTAESWSNITVNESFADYSEYLWQEYKYGKDAALEDNYSQMLRYMGNPDDAKKDLVRYYYADKEDVFDNVSYPKGGRILNMLRHYLGDSAFFKSLNVYLTTYKFGNGNPDKLRLAMEQVSGRDLHWFFNQWYFGSGHPKVEISYAYDAAAQKASVFIKQTQAGDKIFKLPIDIDIYHGATKTRSTVWMENKTDTFTFSAATKPDLINVDGDKYLLWEKKESKTLAEYIHQYKYASNFVDRREAIDFATKNKKDPAAFALLKDGLKDPYFKLRNRSLLQVSDKNLDATTLTIIEKMATNDPNRTVRSYAIDALAKTEKKEYLPLYLKAVMDSSYSVAGAALDAIAGLDEEKAISLLPTLLKDNKGRLKSSVDAVVVLTKGDKDFDEMFGNYKQVKGLQEQFNASFNFIDYLAKVTTTDNFKKGIDEVIAFREKVAQYGVAPQINNAIQDMAKKKEAYKAKAQDAAAIDIQLAYIKEKLK